MSSQTFTHFCPSSECNNTLHAALLAARNAQAEVERLRATVGHLEVTLADRNRTIRDRDDELARVRFATARIQRRKS